jgi:hypothetical protein
MTSAAQIEANRRNARKSTGPRSASGKKRAGENAFRHGLSKRISIAEFDREVETLACQIAGDSKSKITIELARDAADAELELARVRHVRAALIERVVALGRLDFRKIHKRARVPKMLLPPEGLLAPADEVMVMIWLPRFMVKPAREMPVQESLRTAEAVRRILPKLLKLHRYESRAVARRDRAIRELALRTN